MGTTSRELVYQTLEFAEPERAPRHVWVLPWARAHYPEESERLLKTFKWDVNHIGMHLKQKGIGQGDLFALGDATDDWGAKFHNVMAGVHGEVRDPLVQDWERDQEKIHIPREWLTVDVAAVNAECERRDDFILSGAFARPFEQLQFLRGSQNLYLDLFLQPPAMMAFIKEMHQFYCELLELWARETRVDAIWFLDDWGSQKNLLIPPDLWRQLFKPMYRDYVEIARSYGKKTFMHSDGYILAILPELIEIGVDALNAQIFCMGVAELEPYAGKLTFWGEIDRQYLLARGSREEVDQAVREVHRTLWRDGGCIAMCEFGGAARPENVFQVYETWDSLTAHAESQPSLA